MFSNTEVIVTQIVVTQYTSLHH